ncbi:MAG: hypothetical protein Q9192_001963 [Flavoplaca navasiana]
MLISQLVVKGETAPAPLPPSVEAAYKKKCIQLKKRLNEIEADNAAKRIRMDRNKRFIEKMRLEQAIMLEHLGKIQQKKGLTPEGLPVYDFDADDPDSEGSSEGPPTVRTPPQYYPPQPHHHQSTGPDQQSQPNEKPLRSKRSHRRALPSPPPGVLASNNPTPNTHQPLQQWDRPYAIPPPTDHEIESLRHFTVDFDPNPYQPPHITYSPTYPGTFRDHNANPRTEFETWLSHCVHTLPDEFMHLSDDEKVRKAHWAWERLLGENELNRMKNEYDERVADWYQRRTEWEMAAAEDAARARVGRMRSGAGGEGGMGGGAGLRGGEELKVEEGEGDEDMGGGRGGFTAVNG